jgi:integrase
MLLAARSDRIRVLRLQALDTILRDYHEGAQLRITKRIVDSLQPGQIVWDEDVSGFGARLQRRRVSFVLKYSIHGRQRFYTIGRHGIITIEEARNAAKRLIGLIASGIDPAEKRDASSRNTQLLTTQQLCELYLSEGPAFKPNKRQASWATDRSNITRQIVPVLGCVPALAVTSADVVRFVASVTRGDTRIDERTGPRGRAIVEGGRGAAARSLAVLGAIFNFAIHLGLMSTNPAKGVKAAKPESPGRFLSDEEWHRLGDAIQAAREQGRNATILDALLLIALTGCRKSEITKLTWDEIDLDRHVLRLGHSKVGPRMVPLGDEAVALIRRLKEARQSDWVFPSRRGAGPIVGIQKAWTDLRKSANLPGLRIHDLRHSFASEAINSGASLFITGAILGHRQASTTQKYAHLRAAPVREVANGTAARIAALLKTKGVP